MSKSLQKEREAYKNLVELRELIFHPFTITPETAHTAVLLLLSEEEEVLRETLHAITKFCDEDRRNRELIYELGAIDSVLLYIDHADLVICRFALKALAQLCQLPPAPKRVLENPGNLKILAHHLETAEDVFVQEYTSQVLARLTLESLGCQQLVAANVFAELFWHMKNSMDPDVQKNCIQVLSNLLDDSVYSVEIPKNPKFSWPSLLALMHSPFLAIQHLALRTVNQLICRYDDRVLQTSFRDSTGILDLCDILESYEFRDVHTPVLDVIKHYVELEENAEHLFASGCASRLLNYLEMALPAMKPHCLAVFTKMSNTPKGRDLLFEAKTDLVFCDQLMTSNAELLADAAMGIANMTQLMPSAVRMCDTNVIEALCAILNDDTAAWYYVRINALRALSALCSDIPKAACTLVERKTFSAIRNINKKYKETPIEAQRLAVQCCGNLLHFHVSTQAMLNGDFIGELLSVLQRIDTSLKIIACDVLSGLMARDLGKDLFTLKKGEEVVAKNLEIEHVGLRTALCALIVASVTRAGADRYVELGALHYMVEKKLARYVVKTWEPALEAIFEHHPSAKFAYRGRLEINDFAIEGFYVMKRLERPLPTLRALLTTPPPHCQPVFVAALAPRLSVSKLQIAFNNRGNQLAAQAPASQLTLVDDPNLRDYLLKLKRWFGEPDKSMQYIQLDEAHNDVRYRDKCTEVSTTLKERVQLLAEFVQEQMSGLSQERDCSMPSVDLHLADLMNEHNCRVISLGEVRSGGALERAVLFKVLADRLAIPCALVRNGSGHACCQVALPEVQPDLRIAPDTRFPAGLLRANYVVDLMTPSPKLYPVKGYEATKVNGPWCHKPYTARAPVNICTCRSDNLLETVH